MGGVENANSSAENQTTLFQMLQDNSINVIVNSIRYDEKICTSGLVSCTSMLYSTKIDYITRKQSSNNNYLMEAVPIFHPIPLLALLLMAGTLALIYTMFSSNLFHDFFPTLKVNATQKMKFVSEYGE